MSAKIEILKDGVWTKLELKDSSDIKYNARINKIGETSNRQIGSTNTFSLPYTSINIKALGINRFNQSTLALALNRKYEAKYIVDESIIKAGFLLINNTKNGNINVNFIDKALDVVSKWGEITYQDLLLNESLRISEDYQDSIEELRSYSMSPSQVLNPLTNIGSRGYNLCIFPNNLNAIGDDFQKDAFDVRLDDSFNPYQSRPIFNAMSLFDLACERYGYTGIFDESVDWTTIKNTYFISEENDKGEEESDSGLVTITYETIPSYDFYRSLDYGFTNARSTAMMKFPIANSTFPASYSNWKDSTYIYDISYATSWSYKPTDYWRFSYTVFRPDLSQGTGGEIRFTADHNYALNVSPPTTKVIIYWNPIDPNADVINQSYGNGTTWNGSSNVPDIPFPSGIVVAEAGQGEFDLDVTIDKSIFNNIPVGAQSLIGVTISRQVTAANPYRLTLLNMTVSEVSNTSEVVTFDNNAQFENNPVDFTYAASRKTLRSLLIGIMHKEGILMNINDNNKTIKFFTYSHYEKQQENGNYEVWDKYHLKNSDSEWQTNYGNNYSRTNAIGLSSPFKGNIFSYSLENQGEMSRYKASGTDLNKVYKDVENVKNIKNTNNPYAEYTSKGLGLVEVRGIIGGSLDQFRVSEGVNITQGSFTDLPLIANVNYGGLPKGVEEWYNLIDKAVRVKAKFLLPIEVIKNLDLSKPIYVGELGGFYIIEEISEYSNSNNEVTVKLIKLISELGEPAGAPSITLNSTVYDPTNVLGGTDYSILNTISFNNYIPTSATLTATQIENGVIVPGGRVFTQTLTFPYGPYTNIDVEFVAQVPLGSDAGQYRIRVVDNAQIDPITGNLLISNVEFKDWIDDTSPAILVEFENVLNATGVANVSYEYYSFVGVNPTSATFKYTLWDVSTNTALDFPVTIPWPTTPIQDTVLVDLGPSGDYKVEIITNEVTWTSDALPNGVISVD